MIFAEMKTLKTFIFTFGLLIGCSLAAFGQTEDKKEPPKKVNPPTINPVDKDKPKDSTAPKNDSKEPKKPENQLAGGGKINSLVI